MIQIREMKEEDLPQVTEIEKKCFSLPWSEKSYRDFLQREDTVFLTAEDSRTGRVAGYCGVLLVPDEGDITNVAVDPDRRREGTGTLLVKELVRRSAERGSVILFLEVRKSNLAAVRLYEKEGFAKIGSRKNYYEKPTEDAWIMRREEKGE